MTRFFARLGRFSVHFRWPLLVGRTSTLKPTSDGLGAIGYGDGIPFRASRTWEVAAVPDASHGPSVKNPKQYEGLRDKGMPKDRAAAISNANAKNGNASSRKGGKNSHKQSAATG